MANPWERYQQSGPPVDPGFTGKQLDNQFDSRTIDARVQEALAKASKAEADAEVARIKAEAEAVDPMDVETAERAKREQIGNVMKALRGAKTLANKGSSTGMGALLSAVPGTEAKDLMGYVKTLQSNLSFDRLMAMKTDPANKTGGALGAISERELELLGSVVANLDPEQSAEKFLESLETVERHYTRGLSALSGHNPDTKEGQKYIQETLGAPAPAANNQGGSDKTASFVDPRNFAPAPQLGISEQFSTDQDKKFATLAQARFDQGASANELNQLAQQYGYTQKGFGPELTEAIAYRDGTGKYAGQGPQRGARLSAPESGYNDPSIVERGYQAVAASPVGTYFGQAGNALSLGGMDEILGVARGDTLGQAIDGTGVNTAEANLQKSLQSEANPMASILGNVTGGALGAAATGGLAGGLRATGALAPRAIAGDAAFGGLYGAGEANENRLAGAATGMFAAGGGGALGRRLAPKIGDLATGVTDPSKRLLRERGVNLTPGQIFNRTAKEDRRAGLPGSDMPINAARQAQYGQFNRAAFDEGLAPINAQVPDIAERGIEAAQGRVARGYDDAVSGVSMTPDKQLEDALAKRAAEALQIPNIGEQTAFGIGKSVDEFLPTDALSGKNFQNIQQNLTRRAGKFDKSPEAVGPDAAAVLRSTAGDFDDLATRQAPGFADDLQAANKAYGNVKTLQDAVSRGKNTGGVFSPAQLGTAAESSARKFGGRQGTTQRPFFELQRAGQDVLPQKIPDSGTAGRSAEGGIIDNAKSAMRGATAGALYAPSTVKILNDLAFERPDLFVKMGEGIKRRSRLGGMFGAPAFLPTID